MDKLVSIFKKIARLLTIILLLALAVLEFVALIGSFNDGFMGAISGITLHILLMLLYAAPAVLLLVKKDKEALITLSFIMGYLFISNVINFVACGTLINGDYPALTIIYGIVAFTLGLAYAFVLVCFLLEKIFGFKLMKLGFLVLIFSLCLLFVLLILQVIMAIKNDSFDWFLGNFAEYIIIPLAMIFGLMLLEGEEK